MSDIKKIVDGMGHEMAVELLESNDILLHLMTQKNAFLWNEIAAIYADSGLSRKYKQANLSSWIGFSHIKPLAGYSIWSYPLSDLEHNPLNLLYLDNELLLENRGQATNLSLTAFDRVLLYDAIATPVYEDYTEEAGTEQGTPFLLMDSAEDYLYIGANEAFSSITFFFSTFGSEYDLKVEYYKETGTPGWEELDVNDDTSNFESDGRISFTLPEDWVKCAVDGESTPTEYYYIRISTTTTPTIVAQCYSILPGDSVPTLLALSRQQIQDREWSWCYFNGYAYMTIKNEGGGYYEGIDFIKDSSSDTNKENFFESNHHYKTIYEDENYTPSAWEPENMIVTKGTSFPTSPTIAQLFYRTDQNKWYIYKGYATPVWEEITAAGGGAHADTHEDGGSDEVNVGGLSGVLADDQPTQAHNLGGAKHNVDTLANLNAKISDANLSDYVTLTFFIPTADITVGTNKTYEIYAPIALTVDKVYIHAKAAPGTGKTVTVDVNKNGTTIFTTQANRPSITESTKADESGTPDVTSVAKNDIISMDIDEATSGHSATDMTIQVRSKVA